MSKSKPTGRRAGKLIAKTASLTSGKVPATRNANGSIKTPAEREAASAAKMEKNLAKKIGGAKADKPGNGHAAETIAQAIEKAAAEVPPAIAAAPPAPVQEDVAAGTFVDLPLNLLDAALSIAPKADTRHYLNGVFVQQVADDQVRIVATDGQRMFVSHFNPGVVLEWAKDGVIIPREDLERVLKFVSKSVALRVEYGKNQPALKLQEIGGIAEFTVKPVDGNFPNYQRVVDEAAEVFGQESESMQTTQIDSKYLKAAGAIAATLGSKGVIPFLAPNGSRRASVFAFSEVPNALLYIAGQEGRAEALPAASVKLFGEDAMRLQLAKIEEQIEVSKRNAATTKHEHFKVASLQKVERLELRANQLRANLAPKIAAPVTGESKVPPPKADAPASAKSVH